MRGDCGIDERFSERLELRECVFLVAAHQPAIAGDIRRQHGRQSPFHALAGQKAPSIGKNLPESIKAQAVASALGTMSENGSLVPTMGQTRRKQSNVRPFYFASSIAGSAEA